MAGRVADRLVVGFSGDPGARVGVRLLETLGDLPVETHLVMCGCSGSALDAQTGLSAADILAMADRTYDEWNQAARISSGSYLTLGMIVAPCSTRSLASIALGYANNLIHRAADVTMKEARPLTMLVREGAIGPVEREHVARLHTVPGVRVRTIRDGEELDAASLDRLLADVLSRFRLSVAASR